MIKHLCRHTLLVYSNLTESSQETAGHHLNNGIELPRFFLKQSLLNALFCLISLENPRRNENTFVQIPSFPGQVKTYLNVFFFYVKHLQSTDN